VNTNAAFIGEKLGRVGVPVDEAVVVGDDTQQIAAAVGRGLQGFDVAVLTGGLGPTHDDVTVEGVALALKVKLEQRDEVWAAIEARYRHMDRTVPSGASRMALVPSGAEILENRWGTAPGLHLVKGGHHLFVLPGVPREMRGMLEDSVLPRLKRLPGLAPVHVRSIMTAGVPESTLSEKISDLIPGRDHAVRLAFLPGYGGVELRLTTQQDPAAMDRLAEQIGERIGSSLIRDAGDRDVVAYAGDLLRSRGETVATAESCTGGLLGKLLTDRAGSSDYYIGGVVAYSNRLKEGLLGVPATILARHGAVSAETAEAMATGAREQLGATYALSVTGIAGPGGGTPDKPVGMVYLGLAFPGGTSSRKLQLATDREQNRARAAYAAVDFLRRHMTGQISSK
jgi:nicotinamide-nucleotide amidase